MRQHLQKAPRCIQLLQASVAVPCWRSRTTACWPLALPRQAQSQCSCFKRAQTSLLPCSHHGLLAFGISSPAGSVTALTFTECDNTCKRLRAGRRPERNKNSAEFYGAFYTHRRRAPLYWSFTVPFLICWIRGSACAAIDGLYFSAACSAAIATARLPS